MRYPDLVALVSDATDFPILTDAVCDWLLKHAVQDEILFYPADIKKEIVKGYMRRSIERRNGADVRVSRVFYAKSLNFCWTRCVCVKELMHLFDEENELVPNQEVLAQLVSELAIPTPTQDMTDPLWAEHRALFRALMVLCPTHAIAEIEPSYGAGRLSDDDVALFFRVPKLYVPLVMSAPFARLRASI